MTFQQGDPYKDLPFNTLIGLEFVSWSQGSAQFRLPVTTDHLNGAKTVHGGVLAALLDNAVTLCAVADDNGVRKRRCMTLSLNSNFIKAAHIGDVLTVTGRLRGGGRKSLFASAEVVNQHGALVAQGDAVLRVFDIQAAQSAERENLTQGELT